MTVKKQELRNNVETKISDLLTSIELWRGQSVITHLRADVLNSIPMYRTVRWLLQTVPLSGQYLPTKAS